MTSPMPRDSIFGNAVLSRYVAIRQPSLKIGLNFMTLGVPADGAVPRHRSTFQPVSTAERFFRQTTHKTSGNTLRRDMSHLPASSSKGVAVLTAQLDFRTEPMPAISLKIYDIAPVGAIAQSPKVRSEASATCSGLVRDPWAARGREHPVGCETR